MQPRLIGSYSAHDPASSWQVVLRNPGSSKVVLYHARSRSLAVEASNSPAEATPSLLGEVDDEEEVQRGDICPFCQQPIQSPASMRVPSPRTTRPKLPSPQHYFNLLSDSHANTPVSSRPSTPPGGRSDTGPSVLDGDLVNGFYERFFREETKLGRGQRGNVYLCRHILHGNELSLYACKKISVGDSAASLLATLKEVRHLEKLRHPNIVAYHHAWLEHDRVGATAPRIPTLFLLMDFCNGGSLDAFIQGRSGSTPPAEDSREARIRRFKERRGTAQRGAIHFLRLDEIISLFRDIASGLAHLHAHNVLHLDLKAENVLLSWPEPDSLLPTALLSDFGSAEERSTIWRRHRSGATGTLDYVPPEAFQIDPATGSLREMSSQADLWALGLLLHQLCYFRLPYQQQDVELLRQEIESFQGFDPLADHGRHDLPFWLLRLLGRLVSRNPASRPSATAVIAQISKAGADGEEVRKEDKVVLVQSPKPTSEKVKPPASLQQVAVTGHINSIAGLPNSAAFVILVLIKLLLLRPSSFAVQYVLFALGLVEVLRCSLVFSALVSAVEAFLVVSRVVQ